MLQAIARLLGWEPPASQAAGSAETVLGAPPPGLVVMRNGLGMPPPVLDPDALRARNRLRAAAHAGGV